MDADEKLVYSTARMDAYMIIQFMIYNNFYDEVLHSKLDGFIEKINNCLKDEC